MKISKALLLNPDNHLIDFANILAKTIILVKPDVKTLIDINV